MAGNPTPGQPNSPNTKIFTGRKGTVDEGKVFEELMIIAKCLELTLDPNVTEFSISSDDAAFGDFDDLVFETKYVSGEEKKVALQLKHVANKKKVLLPSILGGSDKQFSISKYYRSYVKVSADYSLILYTNKKFEMKDEKLTMDCKIEEAKIRVDILKTDQENRYKFTVNEEETKASIAKANISKENISKINISKAELETYQKFLSRFELMSDQENAKILENRLVNEFLKIHGNEDTFHRFRDFITRWKKAKKNKLNKKMVTIKIVESLLSPFVKTISHDLYYTDFGDILTKAILSFRLTIFEETHEVVHKIWINRMSDKKITKCGIDNFLLSKELDKITDEKLKKHKYSLISWHLNQCPLIVEVTESSKDTIYEAVELLRNNKIEDRKLVLMSQKEQLEDSQCFRNLHCLKDINPAVYREILEKFSCSLQGRLHKLKEIVDSEDFAKIINTDWLVKMSSKKFTIGRKSDKLEFYVPRELPRILVDFRFLEEEITDDFILISCSGKKEEVRKRMKDVRILDVKELLGDTDDATLSRKSLSKNEKIICLHPSECSFQEYSRIIKKFPKRNCHHFNYYGENADLEWINTKGDIKGLRSYRRTREIFEEEDAFLQTSRRNIKIICADPGMGKTTLLKRFKRSKKKPCWLLHVTARQHVSELTENTDVLNFLLKFAEGELERKCIETFYGRREIIFMWDGLDEVMDNKARKRMYGFVKSIQQLGFVQFITARCNLQDEVEEQFDTLATNIRGLKTSERNEYLESRLLKKYNVDQLPEIVAKISENVDYLEAEKILGVPLQLYLMVELFLQTSNVDDIIKEPLTATKLFQYFVSNKFMTHFKKVKNEDAFCQNVVKKAIVTRYKLLGTKICLEAIVDLNFFNHTEIIELSDIEADDDPFGFVTKLGQASVFIHQCYAEYFAALFLSENYRRIANFKEAYFDGRCRNLRFMLDLILAQDCPAHKGVLYRSLKTLEDHKNFILEEDTAGRNALHIALSWSTEHLKLPDIVSSAEIRMENYLEKFKTVAFILKHMLEDNQELVPVSDDMFEMDYVSYSNELLLEISIVTNDINVVKYIYQGKDDSLALAYAAFVGNQDICKFLIDNGAKVNCCDENQVTPLMYAAARGYLEIVKLLIDNNAEANMRESEGRSALFFAAGDNQLPVAEFLVENGAEVDLPNKNGKTPLMMAAQKGNLEIAEFLIDRDAEVNMRENKGRSPLFFAAWNDRLSVVQRLIDNYAEVDLADKWHTTPLIIAAQNGYLDTAQILIDNEAEVNKTDSKGRSPLFFASVNNQLLPVARLLIENRAEVNLPNKYGLTPLVRAAQKGHFDIAKILIENRADVNMTRTFGRSPLFFAAWNNHLPVVQLLIDNKARINQPARDQTTPLMIACEEGNIEIVEYLLKKKAKVNVRNNVDDTALHFSVRKNNLDIIKLLVQNGADVEAKNRKNCTPPQLPDMSRDVLDYFQSIGCCETGMEFAGSRYYALMSPENM